MLSIDNLVIERQGHRILQAEKLTANEGERVAILGPNGAGKSSLLKVICREWDAANGRIEFHGKDLHSWDKRAFALHLGVLPQASHVEFPFTASEVVAIGATPLTLAKRSVGTEVTRFLTLTDALHLADMPFSRLSGGEKQRIQLARVLLQLSQAEFTPLLLLDEPTSAQDLGHQHHIMELVSQLVREQKFCVISVLHDLNIASRYSDQVWVVNEHKLQRTGQPIAVLTPEMVNQHWQYLPEKVDGLKHGFALL